MPILERIDIQVPENELALNVEKSERLERTRQFESTDRVPVVISPNQWMLLKARGKRAADYIRSPVDNLREQILNVKWRIENIRDDCPIPTDSLTFQPDLGCLRGGEFGMDITWQDDQPPKCDHPLSDPAQIDELEVPDPASGLHATYIQWQKEMSEAASDLDVRINGEPLRVDVTVGHGGGPIPAAFALAGSNMLLWMATEPDRMHRLMNIVTESHIRCIKYFDELMGRSTVHSVAMGSDTAEMLSPAMYREFVVPYYLRVWDEFEGERGFHNCGPNAHLLDIIRDDLKINVNTGFGSCVDPEIVADKMGGHIVMDGGPDAMFMKMANPSSVVEECTRLIGILGTGGGYIMTANDSAPGVPAENLNAMIVASKQAGSVAL
jgi:uroporphyrinogen-III decarboxylase